VTDFTEQRGKPDGETLSTLAILNEAAVRWSKQEPDWQGQGRLARSAMGRVVGDRSCVNWKWGRCGFRPAHRKVLLQTGKPPGPLECGGCLSKAKIVEVWAAIRPLRVLDHGPCRGCGSFFDARTMSEQGWRLAGRKGRGRLRASVWSVDRAAAVVHQARIGDSRQGGPAAGVALSGAPLRHSPLGATGQ